MRLARRMRFYFLHQARFSNPHLATEHHLPHPLPYLRPALQQQPHLLLPGHQRCQLILVFLLFEHPTHDDRLGNASEGVGAQRLALQPPLNQPISGAADDYGTRLDECQPAGGRAGCPCVGHRVGKAASVNSVSRASASRRSQFPVGNVARATRAGSCGTGSIGIGRSMINLTIWP